MNGRSEGLKGSSQGKRPLRGWVSAILLGGFKLFAWGALEIPFSLYPSWRPGSSPGRECLLRLPGQSPRAGKASEKSDLSSTQGLAEA